MPFSKNKIIKFIAGLSIIYLIVCLVLFFIQEKMIFPGTKLSASHTFHFEHTFEELNLESTSDALLNGIHFKAGNPKGAILFLHGNRGTLDKWGEGAGFYLENGYDILYIDYRGYGKSTGKIHSETQLIHDAQLFYDYLKTKFDENQIIISGTSIGTGMAAQLASKNNPLKLILHAPYSNLKKLLKQKSLVIPGFLMRYELDTKNALKEVKCPIHIVHGNTDKVIPLEHSLEMKKEHDKIDLTILDNMGHVNFLGNTDYRERMKEVFR